MEVIEVKENSTIKAFHKVPHDIYKDDQNWVPPLEALEDSTFDPTKNAFYKHGDGTRWILTNDAGKAIGRIGAFINSNRAYTFSQPTGGCGFLNASMTRRLQICYLKLPKNG